MNKKNFSEMSVHATGYNEKFFFDCRFSCLYGSLRQYKNFTVFIFLINFSVIILCNPFRRQYCGKQDE